MTDDDDMELWKSFIKTLKPEHSALTKTKQSFKKNAEDSLVTIEETSTHESWAQFVNSLDTFNKRRYEYSFRQLPLKIKNKQNDRLLPNDALHTFDRMTAVEAARALDRSEKKHFYKSHVHQMMVVDLHGYTLVNAYGLLQRLVEQAIQKQIKVLKVITGKGRAAPDEKNPTLRFILPHWMCDSYFQPKIIKIRLTPKEHGGDGAFLVYLRHP